jgi:hypothetical protein
MLLRDMEGIWSFQHMVYCALFSRWLLALGSNRLRLPKDSYQGFLLRKRFAI